MVECHSCGEAFSDQRELIEERYDVTAEEAEELHKTVKTNVMLAAQEAGRDWSNEQYEAVTDVLMGIQYQQVQRQQKMQSAAEKLARVVSKALILAGMAGFLVGLWAAFFGTASLVSDVLVIVSMVSLFAGVLISP